ncbi:MAG: plasmid pRiA4b ORF-3 family protein [Bacteroidales bacterium]|nr:plasmid pRiA4b ORF-3 family protein [Bacteroidales bacterium]
MVYKFKASIAGNKIFMREYEIRGSMTLYSLHLFLQNDLGFAPDQMVVFRGLNSTDKVKGEYGLFDLGDGAMDSMSLEKVIAKGEIKLQYVYDIYKDKAISLELLSTEEESLRRSYPRLVAEKGRNPEQFSDNYDDFEQMIEMSDSEDLYQEDSDE